MRILGSKVVKRLNAFYILITLALLIAILMVFSTLFSNRVTITHKYWDYSIIIYKYTMVPESGTEVPQNAQVYYTKVGDYLDNNSFEHGPSTYYYYVYKPVYDHEDRTYGTDNEPYWSNVHLNEDEIVESTVESYAIEYRDSQGHNRMYWISKEDWLKIKIGQRVKLAIDGNYAKVVKF